MTLPLWGLPLLSSTPSSSCTTCPYALSGGCCRRWADSIYAFQLRSLLCSSQVFGAGWRGFGGQRLQSPAYKFLKKHLQSQGPHLLPQVETMGREQANSRQSGAQECRDLHLWPLNPASCHIKGRSAACCINLCPRHCGGNFS